jgi:hypothetical protein
MYNTYLEMDALIANFNRSTCIGDYSLNGCNFRMTYNSDVGCVVALQHIPLQSCIGEIFGEPQYIWDVVHCNYLLIDDDMIIDVSQQPTRQVLSFINENNQTVGVPNCEIVARDEGSKLRFFVFATSSIRAGEEIVYSIKS